MAQPVFDDHPLRDYLRQSGDVFEPIPGAFPDLSDPFSDEYADHPDDDLRLWSWLPTPASRLARLLNVVITSVQNYRSTDQDFSERFKYDVISSSLLSSSITAPSTRRRSSPSFDDALSDDPDSNPTIRPSSPPSGQLVTLRSPAWSLILFCLCPVSLFLDCFMLYVLTGTAIYYLKSYTFVPAHLPDFITLTFAALKDLIAAAHLWDSTVHEAINLLELDETMASSPPSSPLRVALHSALQSTQIQSDNVRHVLVGLTSPSSLAQLTEMYAPPSPVKPHHLLHTRVGSITTPSRIPSSSTSPSEKRATWNGSIPFSYASLADAGSPSRQSLKRWEKRRSDVSALLLRPSGAVMSAPTTPQPLRTLEGVEEEKVNNLDLSDLSEQEVDSDAVVPPEERGQFGSAALELQRQRRSRGIEAFLPFNRSPPPKYTPTSPQPPLSAHITRLGSKSPQSTPSSPRSSYSASRFTAMQMPRHPLSLHSLTLALNNALSARRYAASHLLSLRFGNGDSLDDNERGGESYWEDVRTVMGLLTSALANATAPLIEALDVAEHERLRTQIPTPSTLESHSRTSSAEHPALALRQQQEQQLLLRRRRQAHRLSSPPFTSSFAPLPSHLARFAAHVDALTNSLNDAREHLESCVASLRDRDSITHHHHHSQLPQNTTDAPALRAYERLRRELGLAFRECERGREPLLELLRPPPSADEDGDEEDEEGLPALGPDASAESSDSEKDAARDARSPLPPLSPFLQGPQGRRREDDEEDDEEDATHDRERGVLVVGLERLPPPGIEQVFEADPDADADNTQPLLARPRSKLSRAERIAATKARRASALPRRLQLSIPAHSMDGAPGVAAGAGGVGEELERWGPGGDVVQELKDVIWKVGERRRLREKTRRGEEDGDKVEEVEKQLQH
ncbi:hypothetical protein BJV74DRAFT_887199 [Russula compacta]|nr:hypothetical protein BJV74DRAFT_887199 [Russula compacta]